MASFYGDNGVYLLFSGPECFMQAKTLMVRSKKTSREKKAKICGSYSSQVYVSLARSK